MSGDPGRNPSVGTMYQPDDSEHPGHIVTVVATEVPIPTLGPLNAVIGFWPRHTIVYCECGSMWSYGEEP